MGIFDANTLSTVRMPHLTVNNDINGGLKCQFNLLNEDYIFFLGTDQWSEHSKCVGFKCRLMNQPIFQCEDLPVMRAVFRQAIETFIARTAIRNVGLVKAVADFKARRKKEII